jgi:hypothetical protein
MAPTASHSPFSDVFAYGHSNNIAILLLVVTNVCIRPSTSANTHRKNGSNVSTNPRRSSMSKTTWERNTTGLMAHVQHRKEHKHKSVENAIALLLREQQSVNFNTVARAAQVSKAISTTNRTCESVLRLFDSRRLDQDGIASLSISSGTCTCSDPWISFPLDFVQHSIPRFSEFNISRQRDYTVRTRI